MKKKRVHLDGRREPLQSRAKESVAGILATSATLLDEVGLDGFNTNLLAERAGVRVSTIYRYFPNKYSIITALTQTISLRWGEWMEPVYAALADPSRDWRDMLRYSSADWISHARSEPGAVSVLQAINATPELREIHRRIFDDMCEKLIAALRQRGVRLAQARLLAIARTFTASQNAGTEIYLQMNGAEATLFREELAASLERYLEVYLEPSDDTQRNPKGRTEIRGAGPQATQVPGKPRGRRPART